MIAQKSNIKIQDLPAFTQKNFPKDFEACVTVACSVNLEHLPSLALSPQALFLSEKF